MVTASPPLHHIPDIYLPKWQKLVDLLAELYAASAVLVNRLEAGRLLVQVASRQAGNPFEAGSDQPLPADAYCAAVIDSRAALWVRDAELEPLWRNRLAANRQLRGYLGVPLLWPDKTVYGTLSVHGRDAVDQPPAMQNLLWQMKRLIESDFMTLHFVRSVERRKASLEVLIQARTAELQGVNVRLALELDQSKRLEEVLRELAVGGSGSFGEVYFRNLVQQLVRLFGGDHAFVAVTEGADGLTARSLAFYSEGQWRSNFGYALDTMPCAQVVGQKSLVVPERLRQQYPRAELLQGLRADSYVGVPLFGIHGEAIGVLVVLGAAVLPDSHLAKELMELLAVRASTEIQRMRAEQHLRRMAQVDDLTGLPNRACLQERLRQAIAQAQREQQVLAVLFVDLDNFKTINDSLGHEVGDALLVDVAQRLLDCLRDFDIIARLGGDEFAALLLNLDLLQVNSVCQRIVSALGQPFHCSGHELYVTASIGISQFPGDGDDSISLLRAADAAMYRAKELGKNQYQYFAQDIKQALQRDLTLVTHLRRAIQQRQLTLCYQPKIRIEDGAMIGAEALVRWTDAELGVVSPAEFIPVAEKSGIIAGIAELVLTRALGDIKAWREAGLVVPTIAINVSPSQLRCSGFAGWLNDKLVGHGLSAACIMIELTEGALLERGEAGLQVLAELTGLGFKISIDDFGTGYSSLSYLKRMPISELKIDRSFVNGIADHVDDRAIASAILSLAKTLGLAVVAEGVETEQQLQTLRSLGCGAAQGYLFYRPMVEPDFRALLGQALSCGRG